MKLFNLVPDPTMPRKQVYELEQSNSVSLSVTFPASEMGITIISLYIWVSLYHKCNEQLNMGIRRVIVSVFPLLPISLLLSPAASAFPR